jgi:hypothetical protein
MALPTSDGQLQAPAEGVKGYSALLTIDTDTVNNPKIRI